MDDNNSSKKRFFEGCLIFFAVLALICIIFFVGCLGIFYASQWW